MNGDAVLRIRQADFGYYSGLRFSPVIRNVSLELNRGEFVVIEGGNGCGKSTIIKALLRMGARFRGTVRLQVPLNEIGYIPQEAGLSLSAPVTAGDVIRSASPFGSVSRGTLLGSLKKVGLEKVIDTRYGSLSGGQRRRVLLARVLVQRARLIILDEPTANIDRHSERLLETLLYRLSEDDGTAVLATTHVAHWAENARRISLADGGES